MHSIIVFATVVSSVFALPAAKINILATLIINSPNETNKSPNETNKALNETNKALNESNKAANKKNQSLTELNIPLTLPTEEISTTIAPNDSLIEQNVLNESLIMVQYVYGGSPAEEGGYPYMVALSRGHSLRSLMCGASIVTKRSIVTAAHCIHAVYTHGTLSNTLRAIVGTNNWEKGGVMYSFTHNATHPHYIPPLKKNDIGILFTTKDIVFTKVIKPIALDFEFIGTDVGVKIIGWGKTEKAGYSSELMELVVETIESADCVADVIELREDLNVKSFYVEPDIEICTYHSRSHGTCQGDSGGPLVRVDNTKLVGIVSWGFPCALGAPDVYTRISAYKEWLGKVIV